MYWYLPYWLEQNDQLAIENLKLGLQLELLRAAMKDLEANIELVDVFLDDRLEASTSSTKATEALGYLEWAISLKLKFISFGLNEALQTIRRLHLKGFDMTSIMNDYKNLWDEYKEKDVWRLIESKTMDMYVSAHNLILKDIGHFQSVNQCNFLRGEQDALKALEDAQQADNPFEFTKATITAIFNGTCVKSKIQDKIVEGAKALELEDHHKALIFEVVARAGLRPLLRRLYRQGTYAIVKGEDFGGMINYEDLPSPYINDDEYRKAAIQYQGKHERSRDLIALLKAVEEKDALEFTKMAVKMIDEKNPLQEVVIDGATRFGQFGMDKQLKPYHKYLILWIAVKENVGLIQRLCLTGPLFPLIYKFDAIPHKSVYTTEEIISATSDDELLKIAVWADEQRTMVSRIFKILNEGEVKKSMIWKLLGELGQLSPLDHAYQLSRYAVDGLTEMSLEDFKD